MKKMKQPAKNKARSHSWVRCLLGLLSCIGLMLQVSWLSPDLLKADDEPRPVRPGAFARPGVIEFTGEITTGLTRYFNNRFEQARRDGVDLLIIEIDSPGGLKIESLEIAGKLAKCDWAYTVAFVPQEAISGGALVALGCDEIFIGANAKFGNIGEIGFDPEVMAFRLIRPKVESSLGHDARELAKAKGRPADLVEAFVDKDITVYRRAAGARFEYLQVRADDPQKPTAPWEIIPETKPERFLTLSGTRAIELNLAERIASDRTELAKDLSIEGHPVKLYRYTSHDTIVHLLNNRLITVLMIAIGLIALYVELSSPGLGAGGLIAGLCMLLFFWSRYLAGTAGWLEVLLFAAGMIFLLMEIFVIPGFGVSGLMGISLLGCSIILASQHFLIPSTPDQWNHSINSMLVLIFGFLGFLIGAALISKHLGSIPLFNRLVLQVNEPSAKDSTSGEKSEKPGRLEHPLISVGDWGTAESLLRPAGRAKFAGRSFDVISDGSFVDPGAQVKVIRIYGNMITVAKIDDGEQS